MPQLIDKLGSIWSIGYGVFVNVLGFVMVSKFFVRRLVFSTKFFLVIFLSLVLGCQKPPDLKPATTTTTTLKPASAPGVQETGGQDVANVENTAGELDNVSDVSRVTPINDHADTDDDALANFSAYSGMDLIVIEETPAFLQDIDMESLNGEDSNDKAYDDSNIIDCDSLEHPYIDIEKDKFTLKVPYFLPDEYVFDDDDSIPKDITFNTLPIFNAPMTPVLCYLRNAINSSGTSQYYYVEDAAANLVPYPDIDVANLDMYLINEMLFQTLVAYSTENTNIDAERVFAQTSMFLKNVGYFQDKDTQEWESKRHITGGVSVFVFAVANFFTKGWPVRKVLQLGGWAMGIRGKMLLSFLQRRLNFISRLAKRVKSSKKASFVFDATLGGLPTYFATMWVSGFLWPKKLGGLEDYNMFDITDLSNEDELDEEALIEIINEGMGRNR